MPETALELVVESAVEEVETCPAYTLRADRRFDILALVGIVRMAREGGAPRDKLDELEAAMRQFELYEERQRG